MRRSRLIAFFAASLLFESAAAGACDAARADDSGLVDPRGAAMVARINEYRAQAGLPAMIYDGMLAAAATNHSRYLAANGWETTNSAHEEKPGLPGFTGIEPWDRCAFVGADCGEEIIAGGNAGGVAGIDQLMDTVFHRWAILGPALSVGPSSTGATVVDFGEDFAAGPPLGHPVVWPVGNYTGPLSFGGAETPDPTVHCSGSAEGTPITIMLYPPEDGDVQAFYEATKMTLRRVRDGAEIAGCEDWKSPGALIQGPWLIPKEPLEPRTAYSVAVTWPGGSYAWQFTTAGDAVGSGENAGGGRGGTRRLTMRKPRPVTSGRRAVISGTARSEAVVKLSVRDRSGRPRKARLLTAHAGADGAWRRRLRVEREAIVTARSGKGSAVRTLRVLASITRLRAVRHGRTVTVTGRLRPQVAHATVRVIAGRRRLTVSARRAGKFRATLETHAGRVAVKASAVRRCYSAAARDIKVRRERR